MDIYILRGSMAVNVSARLSQASCIWGENLCFVLFFFSWKLDILY